MSIDDYSHIGYSRADDAVINDVLTGATPQRDYLFEHYASNTEMPAPDRRRIYRTIRLGGIFLWLILYMVGVMLGAMALMGGVGVISFALVFAGMFMLGVIATDMILTPKKVLSVVRGLRGAKED